VRACVIQHVFKVSSTRTTYITCGHQRDFCCNRSTTLNSTEPEETSQKMSTERSTSGTNALLLLLTLPEKKL